MWKVYDLLSALFAAILAFLLLKEPVGLKVVLGGQLIVAGSIIMLIK